MPVWALLIPLGGLAVGALFLAGVYKLLVRWMDRGRAAVGPDAAQELARLRQEVETLRGLEDRVVELEERLDFAERLLAQQRARELPRGAEP